MSDVDDAEERDAIRERKADELERKLSTPGEPVHVEGEDHLQELVADNDVVLVDFYADWCGPCKMLEPTVEAIAAETTAVVAKVDVDAHQPLAAEYDVQGVPTLYLFADGEPVERLVGVQDEESLTALVEKYA
jgi:thioredoxin 1